MKVIILLFSFIKSQNDCSQNELMCREAKITIPTCMALKSFVVTEQNKNAEFDRLTNFFSESLETLAENNTNYLKSDFFVTKIEPVNADDVENYVIERLTEFGRFYYKVETTEAEMLVCGQASISFEEVFGDEIKTDETWNAEALAIVKSLEFYKSTEQPEIQFYYLNQSEFLHVIPGKCLF